MYLVNVTWSNEFGGVLQFSGVGSFARRASLVSGTIGTAWTGESMAGTCPVLLPPWARSL